MFEEMSQFAASFGFDRLNVFSYSDEEGTSAFTMEEKIPTKIINARAKKLGKIASNIEVESLQKLVGTEISLVIDGESDEHEFLLSARALNWTPDVDGEIYVNDREIEGELTFGKMYRSRITEISGTRPLATITGNA
jgi:tRNA A37 methylthiotransferase MiaB